MLDLRIFRPAFRHWPVLLCLVVMWVGFAWAAARVLLPEAQECTATGEVMLVMAGARAYPERTRLAAELFAAGAAPRILLTNDGLQCVYFDSAATLADAMVANDLAFVFCMVQP